MDVTRRCTANTCTLVTWLIGTEWISPGVWRKRASVPPLLAAHVVRPFTVRSAGLLPSTGSCWSPGPRLLGHSFVGQARWRHIPQNHAPAKVRSYVRLLLPWFPANHNVATWWSVSCTGFFFIVLLSTLKSTEKKPCSSCAIKMCTTCVKTEWNWPLCLSHYQVKASRPSVTKSQVTL